MTAASGGPASATGPLDRLAELGLALPHVATPAGSYLPTARVGDLVFTAGQLPFVDGRLPATGKVGAEVSPEDAKEFSLQAGPNTQKVVLPFTSTTCVRRVGTRE